MAQFWLRRRPLIEVSEEENSGFGIEIVITRRWSHFGFWTPKRSVDIYTGEVADDIRRGLADADLLAP